MARMILPALLAAALMPACGGDDDGERNPPNKRVESAPLGEAIELRRRSGEPLSVTLRSIQDPVRDHPFEDARTAGRFVGVELELRNEGRIPHRGSPWSGSWLTTTRGAERPTKLLKQGSCLGIVRLVIPPGARRQICIPFRLERGARLLKFRYTPEAGFAPKAAVWDVSAADRAGAR